MHKTILATLIICFGIEAGMNAALFAQDDPSIPPARRTYMGRRIAQTMGYGGAGWLIRETREQEERPSEVMKQLGLEPGMLVCDVGCGNGFYSLMMAKEIQPEGKVLAVDIQQEMLHLLKLRADEKGIKNVEPILSTIWWFWLVTLPRFLVTTS